MTERRFDVRELAGANDPDADRDLGRAASAARALEAAAAGTVGRPTDDLAERIMAAVAREPAPRPAGILRALRRRPGLGGLADSLRVAWARAARGGRPAGLRVGAVAYIAAVLVLTVSLTGVAAYTTAGVIGLFAAPATQRPATTPSSLETLKPAVSPQPTVVESPEPSETPEASEPPEASDEAGGSSGGGGTGGGSGVSSGSGESDSHEDDASDSSSQGSVQTPHPSATPEPTSGDH